MIIDGYEQIKGNKFVLKKDAFNYALEQCGFAVVNKDAPRHAEYMSNCADEFEEWFYSGNWVEVVL